jgi:hypothetical protein
MNDKITIIKLQTMKPNFFYHLAALHAAFKMKKTVLSIAITLLSLSAIAAPDEPLLELFNRTFPDAKYIRWVEKGEHHIVSFTQNDTQCRIWYDKKGTLIYSLRYGLGNELPLPVLMAVKKKYRDKHIDGVTEITTQDSVTYELVLSDDQKWYVARVTDHGEVSQKYSLRKQE